MDMDFCMAIDAAKLRTSTETDSMGCASSMPPSKSELPSMPRLSDASCCPFSLARGQLVLPLISYCLAHGGHEGGTEAISAPACATHVRIGGLLPVTAYGASSKTRKVAPTGLIWLLFSATVAYHILLYQGRLHEGYAGFCEIMALLSHFCCTLI